MDAGLGVQPIQGLAEAQAEEIAEGNTSQVVVDGIGTEYPATARPADVDADDRDGRRDRAVGARVEAASAKGSSRSPSFRASPIR